jgi:protease PrsW
MITEILLWAILPSILVSIYIARKDLFPEPKSVIAASILFGFLIFIPHFIFFSIIGNFYWDYLDGLDTLFQQEVVINFFQAAFVEEALKYLVFLFLIVRFNAFNEPMDAIVYGVSISLGFSLMETLEWANLIFQDQGPFMALEDAQIRSWSSNMLHAGCGMIMGLILSKAFFHKKYNFLKLFLALFIPILVHASYNLGISYEPLYFMTTIILLLCYGLIFFGWRRHKAMQKLKTNEEEEKVISLNVIKILGSVALNFIMVAFLINIII